MILYALRCAGGHQFDAWFRNGAAYDVLAAAGEVLCPVCGSSKVKKAPMAPRIGKSRGRDEAAAPPCDEAAPSGAPPAAASASTPASLPSPSSGDKPNDAPAAMIAAEVRQALTALRAHVETTCDYVGERFPEEARRIHYNEAPARPIYGEATPAEAEALQDEGVALRRIPWLPRSDS